MAEFPKLPLWTDAYLGDTTHLTTIEHGAYLLLLIAMWRSKGTRLPNDDKLLARYARLTPGQWARIKPVLMPFFNIGSTEITQSRLTDEAAAVRQHSAKQSDKAKARHLKNKETIYAAAVPEACRNDASLSLSHQEEETGKPVSKKNGASRRQGARLASDWRLPREWGVWALEAGLPEPTIRTEAEKFRDFWTAKSGAGATKLDWQATWRNWVRQALERKSARAPATQDQKLDAWGIGDAQPVRFEPRASDRSSEDDARETNLPGVQSPPEASASAREVSFGHTNSGWTGDALPSLRLVCGGSL